MILGINSLGAGEPAKLRTRVAMTVAHVAGGAVGGASMLFVAWLFAAPFRTMLPIAVVAVGVAAVGIWTLIIELHIAGMSFGWGRQVPATWKRRYGPIKAYAGYGALLGGLVLTFVPYASAYAVLAGAALLLPLHTALLCGALFGVARAVGVASGTLTGETARMLIEPSFRRAGKTLSVLVSLAVVADVLAVAL